MEKEALADHSCDFSLGELWALRSVRSPLTPMYTSTSMMYAVSKETTLTSWRIFRSEAGSTQDYKVIITAVRYWRRSLGIWI